MATTIEALEEQFTRHIQRALATLAAIEMDELKAAERKLVVEACISASDETIRGSLLGQLALARLDLEADADDDADDDVGDDDGEDDED